MSYVWNKDGIVYEDMSLTCEAQQILNFHENLEPMSYDAIFEQQLRDICRDSIKGLPTILNARKNRDLKDYVFRCTQLLTFCENNFGIHYNTSIRVNWCLNHIQMFPQCHNEKCVDKILYKVSSLSVFRSYPLFCRNKSRCLNQSNMHKTNVAQTLLKNYGVPVPAKSPAILQRMKDTCLKNFGYENAFQNPSVISSIHTPEIEAKKMNSLSTHMLERFGVPFYVMTDEFKQKAKIVDGQSREERELAEYVKSLTDKEVQVGSFKVLDGKRQLDIYIPELKLAFEFNGIFYHSVDRNPANYMYHLEKTIMCEERGIKLVHIWEDEWYDDNEKCKDLIRSFVFEESDVLRRSAVKNGEKTIEVDRSKFCKLFRIAGYHLVSETPPETIMRSKQNKDKYLVADCGKLIYEKMS